MGCAHAHVGLGRWEENLAPTNRALLRHATLSPSPSLHLWGLLFTISGGGGTRRLARPQLQERELAAAGGRRAARQLGQQRCTRRAGGRAILGQAILERLRVGVEFGHRVGHQRGETLAKVRERRGLRRLAQGGQTLGKRLCRALGHLRRMVRQQRVAGGVGGFARHVVGLPDSCECGQRLVGGCGPGALAEEVVGARGVPEAGR
eukprot:scaffold7782_cov113-Isochrysis_galbana.AAC.1